MEKRPPRPEVLHVFHTPTYCFLSYRDPDGNCYPYKRNKLQAFSSRSEVQSKNSMNRFKNAIAWMLLFADQKNIYSKTPYVDKKGQIRHNFKFRLAFITLTLPSAQGHSDNYIKEHMLQPFLYWLNRYFKASYVWKAETQLNGNIHFHITIDAFVEWKSIRSKWNSICAKHGYCKVFQDGSNDKGDAATQIKAIRNENDLAKTVGGYLTKGSIEEKEHFQLKTKQVTIDELISKGNYITCNIESKQHYTRFVDGRIWGCSESLSKIKIFTEEGSNNEAFRDAEHQFFHGNKVKKLSTLLIAEGKKARQDKLPTEVLMLKLTDEDLRRKYDPFDHVYVHRHLKFCKIPALLATKIAEAKASRKFNTQKQYTVDSLFIQPVHTEQPASPAAKPAGSRLYRQEEIIYQL